MAQTGDTDINLALKALKIGNKVRELRQKNKFTLQDLAARTGLSKPFLSQIENNRVIPRADADEARQGVERQHGSFFEHESGADKISITRREERVTVDRRPHQDKGKVHYIYTALETKKTHKSMEPFLVEFPVQDSEQMVFMSHEGEEFIYVMEGRLEFRTVDRVEILEQGDSIYIESDLSHSFRRLSSEPAKALAVVWTRHGA